MADEAEGSFDPRIVPARGDIAALHLKDHIEAHTYVSGQPMRVSVPVAPMTGAPDGEAEQTSQLLFGETFTAYEIEKGWVWGQGALDGYVGFVPEAALVHEEGPEPTHRVCALQALVYPRADMKSRPIGALPIGSRVTVLDHDSEFAALHPGGYVASGAVVALDHAEPMWVATAERFKGSPYLWGGRSPAGFDCSGLIQIALQVANMSCPRDSDQQMSALGREAPGAALRRGDIVFWKGHVGVMTSPKMLLHANAHHMEVAEEAFETARGRIAAAEFGEILAVRRITV